MAAIPRRPASSGFWPSLLGAGVEEAAPGVAEALEAESLPEPAEGVLAELPGVVTEPVAEALADLVPVAEATEVAGRGERLDLLSKWGEATK